MSLIEMADGIEHFELANMDDIQWAAAGRMRIDQNSTGAVAGSLFSRTP